ncbi:MAG: metal-dependent transcriptional regulator [Cytophagales bacterium]|nr:metal-dependent transcriptional regulator [Cytophagales bacterium]
MKTLSYTEENYLKALYHLSSQGKKVSTNALADNMNTTPASVNDMLKRLSQKNLITHIKYKGATISSSGKKAALKVIRKHRLWEVFLVETLGFKWDEVHEIAEQLEHIKSPLLVERLDEFLGHPIMDPHGDPIPDENGDFSVGPSHPLSELKVGEKGVVISVGNDDPKLLQYLDKINIHLGSKMMVKDIVEFDNSFEVETDDSKNLFLSNQIANLLLISKTQN